MLSRQRGLSTACCNLHCKLILLSCRPKIVDGRIQKFVAEQALLEQAFIKDTTKTVATVIKEAVATVGEKVSIRRFERSANHLALLCVVNLLAVVRSDCLAVPCFDCDCDFCRYSCCAELHVQAVGVCPAANLGDCCVRLAGQQSSVWECCNCIFPLA